MRVLIVEDEHKLAGALKRGLEQERFAVDVAYEADTGRAELLSGEYDIAVLDRMLPGGDGAELCSEARAAGIQTPIILLTAKSQVRDRVIGLNAGADDYLAKPFNFEELLARVRALLRRPGETLVTPLDVSGLTLNPHTYEVARFGRSIQLSHTEFALLEYLMRHPGQVLSKESLISHVWNFDADILPNTVEAYIGYLRNKIDRPFAGPELLKTVRGFGYKIG
ncbi:MAG TPA: response regulator transcription factor [Patescibacteria group bacterium]|jgi:two-component system OmpR family response regulator|nr:response regulator transcription factor [Patescibacteria group bacterium]